MIAVCPSCHDAIHHGKLPITEETLYAWKGIERLSPARNSHLYVEPAKELRLLTGSMALTTDIEQLSLFKLSNTNRLSLRVVDQDILQISSMLQTLSGKPVMRVVENYVRVAEGWGIMADFRPGHAQVTAPATSDFVPEWVVSMMRPDFPEFALDGRVTVFDFEVLGPGLVRVKGFWAADEAAVVISREALTFCRKGSTRSLSFIGDGPSTVLNFTGPIGMNIFGFR